MKDLIPQKSIGEVMTDRLLKRNQAGEFLAGRYRIIGELGRGGMGIVYKCYDETGGIIVAVKTVPPEISRDREEIEEIRRNYQLVAILSHPNIATLRTIEWDAATEDLLLVLDYVEGINLRKFRQDKGGTLAWSDAHPLLTQIADALDYAHSMQIVHRDVKPRNVMVMAGGHVRVLDFGLAAQIHSSMSKVSCVRYGTSGTGPYMAPEQWRGSPQNGRTDQYALAVLAFELLTSRYPFDAVKPEVLRYAVLEDQPSKPEELPGTVWRVLSRALSKDPGQRYPSCRTFIDLLEGAFSRDTVIRSAKNFSPMPKQETRPLLTHPREKESVTLMRKEDVTDDHDSEGKEAASTPGSGHKAVIQSDTESSRLRFKNANDAHRANALYEEDLKRVRVLRKRQRMQTVRIKIQNSIVGFAGKMGLVGGAAALYYAIEVAGYPQQVNQWRVTDSMQLLYLIFGLAVYCAVGVGLGYVVGMCMGLLLGVFRWLAAWIRNWAC